MGAMQSTSTDRRDRIATAFQMSRDYEEPLTNILIGGLKQISNLKIYGITNPNHITQRVPTVSLRHATIPPSMIEKRLAEKGIFVLHGHNYAYEPARSLDLPMDEGVVRIGLAHYNTQDEVAAILREIATTTR